MILRPFSLIAGLLAVIACDDSSTTGSAPDASASNDGSAILDAAKIDSGVSDATASPDAPSPPVSPALGAHALAYFHFGDQGSQTFIATPPMQTKPSGSLIITTVGRGNLADFSLPAAIPTDNMGNGAYTQLGITHKYDKWTSGTGVYVRAGAKGGANHVITANGRMNADEITFAAVEITNATKVQDFVWNEPLGPPLKSAKVTTTGPATLVAFWWGDGYPGNVSQTAVADSGFTVIDSVLVTGAFVQCAVATKTVATAGTYDVTWTATPSQGAQLWLVAVQ